MEEINCLKFVDLQVNGYKGVNFSDIHLTLDDVKMVSREMMQNGTVAYCPTVITSSIEIYRHNLPIISKAMEDEKGARILGIHLEGPFINPDNGFRGLHPKSHIIKPDLELLKELIKISDNKISLITLAPEIDGAIDLIEFISNETSIITSIGHNNASALTITHSIEKGVKSATHIGNGIPSAIDRHLNPIWPILADDRIYGMFITDGFHIPADFIKVGLKCKGFSKFIVVSDVSHLGGKKPGNYVSFDHKVRLEENKHLYRLDVPQLAGSASLMKDCIKFFSSIGDFDSDKLKQVGYYNPLALLEKEFN